MQLRQFKRKLAREIGQQHVYILEAHLLILKDRMLLDEVAALITQERANAEWALQQVIQRFRDAFAGLDDPYLREKADDMDDIGSASCTTSSARGRSGSRRFRVG